MTGAHFITHFTHINNLPGIFASGCLQADNLVDRSSALQVEAADLEIKTIRKSMQVPPGAVRLRGRLRSVLLRAAFADALQAPQGRCPQLRGRPGPACVPGLRRQ
jgi:hypothetical protein